MNETTHNLNHDLIVYYSQNPLWMPEDKCLEYLGYIILEQISNILIICVVAAIGRRVDNSGGRRARRIAVKPPPPFLLVHTVILPD